MSNRLMYMKIKDDDMIIKREKSAGRMNPDEFNTLKKRKITIPSPFGYPLKMMIVEPSSLKPLYYYLTRSHRKEKLARSSMFSTF